MSTTAKRGFSGALALGFLVLAVLALASLRSERAEAFASGMLQTAGPRTRAEVSNYTVTSSHADVVAFIDSLKRVAGNRITVGSIGRTVQGRDLPYIVASRPPVTTPAQARALNRPIVYVQGNIHSGEVEGKEALQAILRDLVLSARPNVLDSVVLIAVPIYNADGNENTAPQARARGSQNGPELVGTRPNSEGTNLNRDYVKAFTNETKGSLQMFTTWDPHVFVDLHTSNGSMHGYAITYSPPLNPAAVFTHPFTRDSLLPDIRRRMRDQQNFETFDYGNWSGNCAAEGSTCSWGTYDHTPRYGTNYYGLRGRIAILSEAFSHDPFEKRVKATYAFVAEILSVTAAKSRSVMAVTRMADSVTTAWGRNPASAPQIAVRSRLTANGFMAPVLVAEVERVQGDTTRHEPGLGVGQRKTGRVLPRQMTIRDRFDPVLTRSLPYGYAISAALPDSILNKTLALLRLHGVVVQQLTQDWSGQTEVFKVDTKQNGRYENFATSTVTGTWRTEQRNIARGSWVVSSAQPLAVLALYMLEPESDDGIVTYTTFDPVLEQGSDFPVVRLAQPLSGTR
jgi:hypothetical protein